MKVDVLAWIAPALFMLCACNSSNTTESNSEDTSIVVTGEQRGGGTAPVRGTLTDEEFAHQAANGGMAEVALGELAVQKATDPKVKEFAHMMIKDHTKANEELKALATNKNITLPSAPAADKLMVKENLAKLSGSAFDKAYMEQMVNDHTKTIALFEKGMTTVEDPELKTFIENKLPTIKRHLEHCQSFLQ